MARTKKKIKTFDRWMMAVTFAEAGEGEMALEMMGPKRKKKGLRRKVKKWTGERPVLRA